MPAGDYEPVIRCSICTGEQVICAKERNGSRLIELMAVRSPEDIDGFCGFNSIDPKSVRKIY
ncbi:MAG: aspartate dehydrogenase [Mogibacterium sp.]|nr:aspartate dehydrogenase [Mogibacterium sp.]